VLRGAVGVYRGGSTVGSWWLRSSCQDMDGGPKLLDSIHAECETFYKLELTAKMLGITYESSDEEDFIPAIKADVSREHVCEGP
jgi:hypothetical protein